MMSKKAVCLFLISLILALPISFSAEYNISYDGNGNIVQDINNYYEYDEFNQLKKVRGGNSTGRILAEYYYDHNGDRIKKIDFYEDGKNTTTYYIGKKFVRVVNDTNTVDSIYYYHNDELIGQKDSNGKIYFYHPDHLGSTNLVTDGVAQTVEETSYLPFGDILEGGSTRFTFTGKEKDSTGIMYYGARYYSSFLRKFTQPDTIIQNIYDPQNLNRYSYVNNNPLKYIDPSGHFVLSATAFALTMFVVTAVAWVATGYVAGYAGGTILETSIQTGENFASQSNTNFLDRTTSSVSNVDWGSVHQAGSEMATNTAAMFGVQGLFESASLNLGSLRNAKTDYYVKPNGEVVPSKAYHHIGSESPRLDTVKQTKLVTPNPETGKSWLTFDKMSDASSASNRLATYGKDSLIRTELDTLQIIDDLTIPAEGPFTEGGAYQAVTSSSFKIDNWADLRNIKR